MKKLGTKSTIEINADASLAYLPSAQALVRLSSPGAGKKVISPTAPIKKPDAQSEFAPWGPDNREANDILDEAMKNSIIPSTLMWKANQVSAGGVMYGTVEGLNAAGHEKFVPVELPEVEDFLEANAIDLYLEEGLRDLYWWANTYVDFYKSVDGKKIAALCIQEALDCRFSPQNKTTGRKEFVFIDGNFPDGKPDTWTKLPALDPYYNVVGQILESKSKRLIYPLSFSSPGEKMYQKASWHSIVTSGWLAVAEKIPLFKKYLMDNQMSIKYIIHIPESWWKWKFKGWESMTDARRAELQKTELTEINNVLTGVTNTGKSLAMTFKLDAYGKNYTKWEIIPLNVKTESGTYVEDSQEVSSHILYSLLVDGTLIGNSPGKQMGAGSGSDKLRANNIFILNNKVYMDKMLKPLQIITSVNQWKLKGKKIVWRSRAMMLATLDTGKTTAPADTAGGSEDAPTPPDKNKK